MDHDEDEEVLVQGSELYSYLAEHCKDSFQSCERSGSSTKISSTIINTPPKTVSAELHLLVTEILHCDLLLDEDASYLYSISSELLPMKNNIMYKLALVNGIVAVTSSCFYLYFKESLYFSIPVASYAAYSLCNNAVQYFNGVMWKKQLTNLHNSLKKLHFYIRKTGQYLNENDALIFRRSMTNKTRKRAMCSENFVLERECVETKELQKVLHQCLLDMINAFRTNIQSLMQAFPLTSSIDNADHYLGLSSFEQMNINIYERGKDCNSTPSVAEIEVLKNVYILMQSESLRRLGLCFCPNVWTPNSRKHLSYVFEVVQQHTLVIKSILNCLQYKYKSFFSPKLSNKEINDTDPKWLDGYSSLHKFSLSLNSVLYEVRLLEDYLDLNKTESLELKLPTTNKKMKEIEIQFQDAFKCYQETTKYFKKTINSNINVTTNSIASEEKPYIPILDYSSSDTKSISVGYSDFTPNDTDRVYLCVTDGEVESYSEKEIFEETPLILPSSVLNELKGVLANKKREFEERESKALKGNLEYDHYLSFLEDKSSKLQPDEEKVENILEIKNETDLCGCQTIDRSVFQKNLAVTAVQKAFQINNMHEEVTYGNDNDDSD